MNNSTETNTTKSYKPKYENIIFVIICCIGGTFLITPILLRVPFFSNLFSLLLSPLKTTEYKSSYIETFGAILGTFMAVSGALWTQKKIDEVTEKKNLKESALIIYYDFYFATNDIRDLMENYLNSQGVIANTLDDIDKFKRYKKKYRLYLDDNWIRNVASLSHILSSEDTKILYKVYGDLNTVKQVINISEDQLSIEDAKTAYSIMFNEFCDKTGEVKSRVVIDVELKDSINDIINKLKQLANID
ncbi:hypothetical protein [Clostridium sp. C8-1-8]|uniref:hypothetical protein n=1 Tax=Clostridium sp. C8-1-8 TaxID=2698831 RepID=UPI00136FC2D3|nr:hypothetical protein [Clostridium sp. C8-1-8]